MGYIVTRYNVVDRRREFLWDRQPAMLDKAPLIPEYRWCWGAQQYGCVVTDKDSAAMLAIEHGGVSVAEGAVPAVLEYDAAQRRASPAVVTVTLADVVDALKAIDKSLDRLSAATEAPLTNLDPNHARLRVESDT